MICMWFTGTNYYKERSWLYFYDHYTSVWKPSLTNQKKYCPILYTYSWNSVDESFSDNILSHVFNNIKLNFKVLIVVLGCYYR
jgi:hypothetical protein